LKARLLLVGLLGATLLPGAAPTGSMGAVVASKPLGQSQILELVRNFVPSARLARLVRERGIDFEPSEAFLRELKRAGAEEVLLRALRAARPVAARPADRAGPAAARKPKPERGSVTPSPTDRPLNGADADYLPHWDRGDGRSAPPSLNAASAHLALGDQLSGQGKMNEALAEYRRAVQIEPDNVEAHRQLSRLLFQKGDLTAAVGESREVARLAPGDAGVRLNLGLALYFQGDLAGATREYREALRLKPDDPGAHALLAAALKRSGELNAAMAEYREAVRLNPSFAAAHHDLGALLEAEGDRQNALAEYREAFRLNPHDAEFKSDYERLAPKN
jgi:tetratricopeptide (TPR) repeat protein